MPHVHEVHIHPLTEPPLPGRPPGPTISDEVHRRAAPGVLFLSLLLLLLLVVVDNTIVNVALSAQGWAWAAS